MTQPSLADRLATIIEAGGPISVAKFMAAANAHYYATRDPLGVEGDFITAPEISQMFGELIGLWLADLWLRAGRPDAAYVELGPGRGTLAADALRAMATVGLQPPVHFVETSPALRERQRSAVTGASWHDHVSSLPNDQPLLIVANEFFDALPVHQLVHASDGWRQRAIDWQDGRFVSVAGSQVPLSIIPDALRDAPEGSVIETCPEAVDIVRQLSQRIGEQGGAALFIDYGYDGPATGDTLQAVKSHEFADRFAQPGERDLTAHVDFQTLGAMGEICGVAVHGAVGQGDWLLQLGLAERAESLIANHPERRGEIEGTVARLTDEAAMGTLFRVLATGAPDWPKPVGFDPS